jgi:hypothetical protein
VFGKECIIEPAAIIERADARCFLDQVEADERKPRRLELLHLTELGFAEHREHLD